MRTFKNHLVAILSSVGSNYPLSKWDRLLPQAFFTLNLLRPYKLIVCHGHPTKLHILDNECSQDLKDAFQKYSVPFKRVSPKEHRANLAERAIRTFKNHIVAILS